MNKLLTMLYLLLFIITASFQTIIFGMKNHSAKKTVRDAAINIHQQNDAQLVLNKTDKNYFIQNKGQWAPEVKYLARIGGMDAWITTSGVVYDYYKININYDEAKAQKMTPDKKQKYEDNNTSVQGHVVKLHLVNAEKNITSAGNNQREGYVNYFIGNDKSKWADNVPLYDNVELQGVYKDIDVKYYYDNGMLRYDYKAKPGADISQLKFKFEGQEGIRINDKGELILKTSLGEVTNGKIYAYQTEGGTQKEVACKFEQRQDGTIGLKAGSYDAKKELIIDPLVYSTFLGGSQNDYGTSIAVDASGNAYITGYTKSLNFPTTTGAYQTTYGGGSNDIFVTNLNPAGSALVYSTYLGGSNNDEASSIAVDAGGNAYITGYTKSPNYTTTTGAFQTALVSDYDAFVTKLNSTGSPVYSTYIGSSSTEQGASISLDASGNAYITGYTSSSNYPTTTGAFQTALGGGDDAFVTKLSSDGSALVYSTFIGGTYDDYGTSIAVDASGNAYITGHTASSNYPTTSGAFQTAYGGSSEDAFVTKLNSTGAAVYSTFLGGSDNETGTSIAVDAGGNTYITGFTGSTNYPITAGAYQTALSGLQDAFVTKLNPTGFPIYSTFIGGSSMELGTSIAINAGGNAYITGYTNSTDYPITSGAYQTAFSSGNSDAFITELNSLGSALVYSTFIGGNGDDYVQSIAVDAGGNTYVGGYTSSSNYPTTSGAFQATYGTTSFYAFITKLSIQSTPGVVQLLSPVSGSTNLTLPVTIKWSSASTATTYGLQISADSTFTSTTIDVAGLTDTTYSAGSLNASTTYYCRVRAMNGAGWGAYSSFDKFTTLAVPEAPILIFPNSSSDVVANANPVQFLWKSLSFATAYELQIAADNNCNTVLTDSIGIADTLLTFHLYYNYYYSTFYWRVRGINASGTGQWSDPMKVSLVTGINDNKNNIPVAYQLYQNYPNPFNPSTLIKYALPFNSTVKIEIYNILGAKVKELINEQKSAGYYSVNLNTTGLASGVYLYILRAKSTDGKNEYRDTKKMILLK